jgi:diadenosine tetraphosphatase ApaH/serine/threonine PP2A family protein phosphatase
LGRLDEDWFNDVAWEAIKWTKARLSAADLAQMQGWPEAAEKERIQFTHGSLNLADPFDYLDSEPSLTDHFAAQSAPLCFVGHTHSPAIWTEGREVAVPWPKSGSYRLVPGLKTVINVGSVGFCRTEDPRPSWVTYDPIKAEVTLRRAVYDVEATAQAIRRIGHRKHIEKRLLKDLGR